MRRVVVTGLGVCAPVQFEEAWQGKVGLVAPANWEIPGTSVRVGRVPGDVPLLIRALPGSWKPDRMDPFSHFALLAAHRARADSGLTEAGDLEEAAVVVASAMGGERTHHGGSEQLVAHQLIERRVRLSPFTAPKLMPNAAAANVSILLGAHGPSVSPAAACASGAYALAQAVDLIRLGRAEVAFAGAAEAPCEEIAARAFLAGDALSSTGASLPFHRARNGFVLAEGSAILVLEERERAVRRGARIYAEWGGAGLTADAYHVVAPHPEGTYSAAAMRAALREAELTPNAVGYVNAHATGTQLGDAVECRALQEVFGSARPWISSTKGATGHLLGAAGALEAAYTVLALATGRIPPTAGLAEPDAVGDDCATGGFDFVPEPGRERKLRAAMTNSFAFGGHNACLVFKRVE